MNWLIFFSSIPFISMTIFFFKNAAGTLNPIKINFVSYIFYWSYIATSLIGGILILFNIDNHHMLYLIENQDIRIYGYVIIIYTFFILSFMLYIVPKLFRINMYNTLLNYYNKKVIQFKYNNHRIVFYSFLILFLTSLVSVLYTFYRLGYYPYTFLLINYSDPIKMAIARNQATFNFEGNVYVVNILAKELTILLSYISYVYARKTKLYRWKFMNVCLIFISLSILFYNFAKSPVFWYLISFLILKVYLGDKLKIKEFMLLGIIVIVGIIIMYVFVMGLNMDEMTFNRSPIGRVTLSQISGLYNHLDVFPNKHNFLLGQGFPSSFRLIFGIEGPTIKSSRVVQEHVYPRLVREDRLGVMSTLFQGEVYGNFGMIGIVLAPFYVGFLLAFTNILFLKFPKTPINIGLFVYLIMELTSTITSQFIQFVWHPIVFSLVFFIIYIKVNSHILYDISDE